MKHAVFAIFIQEVVEDRHKFLAYALSLQASESVIPGMF
jgi:hypothetical protein